MPTNTIQVEFFHTGRDADTLHDVMRECRERYADGANIKTVIRMFDDQSGTLTKAVQRYQEVNIAYDQMVQEIFSVGCGIFGFREWRAKRLMNRREQEESVVQRLVLEHLRQSVRSKELIGIERHDDRRFRQLNPDETHELLEAAEAAVSIWVFVFAPNDLFADKNVGITCMM